MAKCEKCGKEMHHQKRIILGVTGQKVCHKCYHHSGYTILEQLGLPEIEIKKEVK